MQRLKNIKKSFIHLMTWFLKFMPNVPAPSNNHVRDDFSNDREPIASSVWGWCPITRYMHVSAVFDHPFMFQTQICPGAGGAGLTITGAGGCTCTYTRVCADANAKKEIHANMKSEIKSCFFILVFL